MTHLQTEPLEILLLGLAVMLVLIGVALVLAVIFQARHRAAQCRHRWGVHETMNLKHDGLGAGAMYVLRCEDCGAMTHHRAFADPADE